jgi:hypothetical protein
LYVREYLWLIKILFVFCSHDSGLLAALGSGGRILEVALTSLRGIEAVLDGCLRLSRTAHS